MSNVSVYKKKLLELNDYLELINKVKNDLGLNVILDNSLFAGNNNISNNIY